MPLAATALNTAPAFASRHYSPAEIAEMWGLSVDSVRRMFECEPGVLVISTNEGRYRRRRYRTLRIPAFVVERVHRRLSVVTNSK
jgi:hypothetical protein